MVILCPLSEKFLNAIGSDDYMSRINTGEHAKYTEYIADERETDDENTFYW